MTPLVAFIHLKPTRRLPFVHGQREGFAQLFHGHPPPCAAERFGDSPPVLFCARTTALGREIQNASGSRRRPTERYVVNAKHVSTLIG